MNAVLSLVSRFLYTVKDPSWQGGAASIQGGSYPPTPSKAYLEMLAEMPRGGYAVLIISL